MTPERTAKRRFLLAAGTGILLSLAYPPIPTGALAFVAFIPFFFLFEEITTYWRGFRYAYLAFFVLNVLTLYWTGGFTHGRDTYMMVAGGLLLLAHPFFFCVPILAFICIRRSFGYRAAVFAFPFLWVAFEYLHASTELSFPWLTLANTQTYDRDAIQFISITGSYGLTMWIMWINVLTYSALSSVGPRGWKTRRVILPIAGAILLLTAAEWYGSAVASAGKTEDEGRETPPFRVALIQPNIDPFEKWAGSPSASLDLLGEMTRQSARTRPDLVLWPETAIPFYVTLSPPGSSPFVQSMRRMVDSLDTPLLTGMPEMLYYQPGDVPPKSSKKDAQGNSYETFNASMLIAPQTDEIQRYEKIRLVPFAERVPFSEQLSFLNAMRWNFGLGGWGIGRDTTVFSVRARSLQRHGFANLICYESMYPDYVAEFVRRGAEFITIITNDSWWGNTSGTYQHRQAAVLRAVENRRWVVQCANGGLSFSVDPYGRLGKSTVMFLKETLEATIEPRSDVTWYTAHGDWLAGVSTTVAVAIVLLACFSGTRNRYRRKPQDEHH